LGVEALLGAFRFVLGAFDARSSVSWHDVPLRRIGFLIVG
jgi:hypothetical protein